MIFKQTLVFSIFALISGIDFHKELEKSLDKVLVNFEKDLANSKSHENHKVRRNTDAGYFPKIRKKKQKVRTCQNMAGIIGGSNAFNFINFVAAVVTLVVNVNNNINNNNNNLNNINVNTNNANNANVNANNNGVNSVVVMPGRKRRRRSDKFEETEDRLTEKPIDCRNARRSPVEKVSRDLVEKMQNFFQAMKDDSERCERNNFCGVLDY